METLHSGLTGEANVTVSKLLTASHMGSGRIPVYATPAMVALMEAAAVSAIGQYLDESQTSVGISIEIKHLAATPIGQEVRARAEVIEVNGRRVTFSIQAWDEQEKIGEGTHTRFIVDAQQFLERVQGKLVL